MKTNAPPRPQITREPGPVPGIGTKILACTDPDGYKVGALLLLGAEGFPFASGPRLFVLACGLVGVDWR